MLCDPKYDQEWITVIPIVGFGVFNNERVKQHFDLTKWAYVPKKDILIAKMGKNFKSFTKKDYNNLSLDQIKRGITESVDHKKYLLYLRVLIVEDNWITKLPNSIGRMMHLRYLKIEYKAFISQIDSIRKAENLLTLFDLKDCNDFISLVDPSLTHRDLEYLPDSITRLENLQTLNLEHYNALRELPSDLTNLVNLRHLLLPSNSSEWTDLPSGFGNLTSLQELNWFIVGKSNGIDSLPSLSHRGELKIRFCEWRRNATLEAKRAALKNSDELTYLELRFEEKVTPALMR
ncbi:putative disease resistance protein RGA4 [Bienertia sinuspersici]